MATQEHSNTRPDWAERMVIDLRDLNTLQYDGLSQLGALFDAIKKDCPDHPSVTHLAKLGSYLCADWSNSQDVQIEGLLATLQSNSGMVPA